ncbi:MAG TPA: adenylate/guanylate cyclase domain-containing protein [Actinotalea sp.]
MPDEGSPDQRSTLSRLEDELLGGPRTLTIAQVAERAHASVEDVRLTWQALGLPTTAPEAVAFTEQDARLIALTVEARDRYEVSERTAVSLVRSAGHTADRLAVWQAEAIVEHLVERYELDDVTARLLLLDRLPELVPLLEAQLVHAWRRHMAVSAARFAAEFALSHVTESSDELPLARAVGFADIVSFTVRTAALTSHDLAEFVQAFESQARDVVTSAGGRVVKTIGDAVLFVADDAATGADVALGLADVLGSGSASPVRIGLVWGRVLSRFGDVFGPSVNLAARLTAEAHPGTVFLDEATAATLAGEFEVEVQPPRAMAGLGTLRPVRLVRRAR